MCLEREVSFLDWLLDFVQFLLYNNPWSIFTSHIRRVKMFPIYHQSHVGLLYGSRLMCFVLFKMFIRPDTSLRLRNSDFAAFVLSVQMMKIWN